MCNEWPATTSSVYRISGRVHEEPGDRQGAVPVARRQVGTVTQWQATFHIVPYVSFPTFYYHFTSLMLFSHSHIQFSYLKKLLA